MSDVIFNGPEGRLVGRYHQSKRSNAPIALLLHPHPQHGGTMNNKVVFDMYQGFVERGFSVLRFNFRGVGNSQGVYDNGLGELSDAASALDWLQAYNPNSSTCWIGGFSFGAWISMQLMMRRPEIEGFISIAPPASEYDFSFLAPCPASGIIIHGENDGVVPISSVEKLADKLQKQNNIVIDYRTIKGADHFFASHMDTLNAYIADYLDNNVTETV